MPDEPEVIGLLALMLLIAARRPARTGAGGELVPLHEQDRDALGPRPRRRGPGARPALPAAQPSRARTRCRRPSMRCTAMRRGRRTPTGARSWPSTTSCVVFDPSPVVALNRAVALAEVEGPAAGLAAMDGLPLESVLPLPRRAGRPAAATRPSARGGGRVRGGAGRAPTTRPSAPSLPSPGTGRPTPAASNRQQLQARRPERPRGGGHVGVGTVTRHTLGLEALPPPLPRPTPGSAALGQRRAGSDRSRR